MKGGRRVIMLKVAPPPPIGKRDAPWPIKPPKSVPADRREVGGDASVHGRDLSSG